MKSNLVCQGNTNFSVKKNLDLLVNSIWNTHASSFSPYWLLYLYWRYAIFFELCYFLWHIPRSIAILFLNVMLQYMTLTSSYADSSYAMFSGQSRGRISGYCCNTDLYQSYNFWTTYYIVLTFFECYCWQKYTTISNTDLYLSYFKDGACSLFFVS